MRKIKSMLGIFLLFVLMTSCLNAQTFQKRDSVYAGDSVASINPTGNIEKMGFTLWSTVIGDTLWPQAQYGTDLWVNTSIKNVRLQTSDTIIRITANSWPTDYELNDPVITAFRLWSKAPSYIATRKTFVNFRYRKRQ